MYALSNAYVFFNNAKIKIAPSVDKGRILTRILVTASICKGLSVIWCGSHLAYSHIYFLIYSSEAVHDNCD